MNEAAVRLRSRFGALLVVACLAVLGVAFGQAFDAGRYYQQCLRFEEGGDFETAAQACENALQIDPAHTEARVALARTQIELGDAGRARNNLLQVRERVEGPEPSLLLARVAVAEERLIEAESHLREARASLEEAPDREVAAQVAFVSGRVAELRGHAEVALERYREALEADPLEVRYRLADAELRFHLGDASGARAQLAEFQRLSGEARNADVRSLLGRTAWSVGDLSDAAGQLETALALRGSRGSDAQARDLRVLGLVYLGDGDLQSGILALREAGRRGNPLTFLGGTSVPWLLVLVVVVGTHLVAESRIATRSSLEVVEGPQMWTVGQVYGILVAAGLLATAVAFTYGLVVFDNALALLTPLQSNEVRAVLWVVFALLVAVLSAQAVRRSGWSVSERLLGGGEHVAGGILVGVALLAALLVYLAYRPEGPFAGPWHLDLSRLSPTLVAAVVLLPLTELFFRPLAFQALEHRYDTHSARLVTAGLTALVLVTPTLWLFGVGLVLSETYRRYRSGMQVFVAQLVLHVGLVVAAAFSPWARGLFF